MLTVEEIRKQPEDQYMSKEQLEFFRDLLLKEKEEAFANLEKAKADLSIDSRHPDLADSSDAEMQKAIAARLIEHQKDRLAKVDAALEAMLEGEYGFCVSTGEPIGIERLLAFPATTTSCQSAAVMEAKSRNYTRRAAY